MVQWGCRGLGGARTTEELYCGDRHKQKCGDHTGIQECAQLWAQEWMRPLSEKSPASTDRRLHRREVKVLWSVPGRTVPGISFQLQGEESSSLTDESTESMDLESGVGNCSIEWISPLATVGWSG